MKYCPGCATALDDNIRKCPQCGHVFADVKPEFESSQRSENENARITSTQPEQPPIYSAPLVINQNTVNNSTQPQPVPKWKRWLPLLIAISVVGTIMQTIIQKFFIYCVYYISLGRGLIWVLFILLTSFL